MSKRTRLQNVDKSLIELYKRRREDQNITSFPEFTRRVTDELRSLEEIRKKIKKEEKKEGAGFAFRI